MILKGMSKKELKAIISNLNTIIDTMKEEEDKRIAIYQSALINVYESISSIMSVRECCWECTGPEDCLVNDDCPFQKGGCSKC